MKLNKYIGFASLALAIAVGASSCKKTYLDTKPTDQVVYQDVFKTTQGARSVINGIHRTLYSTASTTKFGMPSINLMYDLMGEDLGMTDYNFFYEEASYASARGGDSHTWGVYYDVINNANFVLMHIDAADGPESDKVEIKGQAYAMRGWAYLQLIQTYQFAYNSPQYVVANGSATLGEVVNSATIDQALGVPIYTTPGQTANPRASLREVVEQINNDFNQAENFLKDPSIPSRSTDKSQVNIDVLYGLKARAALYQQNWNDAANYARMARASYPLSDRIDLNSGFNDLRSREWIWGSKINQEANGIYASFMSHMDPIVGGYAATCMKAIGRKLWLGASTTGVITDPVDTLVFKKLDSTDYRITWWIPLSGNKPAQSPYNNWARGGQRKFTSIKSTSFLADYPLMRSAEMYLIEAEALAMGNKLDESKDLLQAFMDTRNSAFNAQIYGTKYELISAIWRQRRLELWGEGFRLFDAKRQMARLASDLKPLVAIDRAPNGHWDGNVYNANKTIQSGSPLLNFRIPGGELAQNPGCVQNP